MSDHPSYGRVLLTFARNSLIRDMTFRTNFLLESISSLSWTVMNVGFYLLVFHHTRFIGPESGWGKFEFFVFLATTWFINSLVQAFFMPNAQEFSELIRTGNLDLLCSSRSIPSSWSRFSAWTGRRWSTCLPVRCCRLSVSGN
jgi:ABC-2 type transport system permease protein